MNTLPRAHFPRATNRREFLLQAGGGCGALALHWLLARDGYAAPGKKLVNPLAAKPPHFEAKAKSVIFMFMVGGPSHGAWVTYGLGSASDNLPAYCVLLQPEGTPEGGAPCWGSGFLPAVYQGTLLRKGASPILNLKPPETVSGEQQRRTLDLLQK